MPDAGGGRRPDAARASGAPRIRSSQDQVERKIDRVELVRAAATTRLRGTRNELDEVRARVRELAGISA